ncbi:competence protein CoiA family protein [Aciduricibacillus chroicocephali]|uniref:Competence protein CoiA family protein n=1 Tax=Aciduricibacillus chroicocephali TaxID=3054939 RepID=A0ABY9KXG0_9BACI|nr:competence protein CoiA family protein [Bacillaceae bacterium 44XB]
MLQAIDESGQSIIPAALNMESLNYLKKERHSFYCPECKKPVILKAGRRVIPHFAHFATSNCGGGEGGYHENGKWQLFNWLANQNLDVSLEAFLEEVKRRPDILLKIGDRRIVIEYQCAQITQEEIRSRMDDYDQAGLEQIWILGGNRLKRLGSTSLSLDYFSQYFLHRYKKTPDEYLYFYCPGTIHFAIFHNPLFANKRKAFGTIQFSHIKRINFKDLFQPFHFKSEQIAQCWENEKESFRKSASRRCYGEEMRFHQWLYSHGWHVSTLPACIGLPVRNANEMRLPTFHWQARLVMEIIRPAFNRQALSLNSIKSSMSRFVVVNDNLPILQEGIDPVVDYVMQLSHLGYLNIYPDGTITCEKRIDLHRNVEHSLHEDSLIMQKWLQLQKMPNQKKSMIPANSAIL